MKNIVFIGMPGSGKTTIGSRIAKRLNREFIDADVFLEAREKKTVGDLFFISEEVFRDAEMHTLELLSKREGIVISTGGGAVKRQINIDRLKENGIIFHLDRTPEDIISDVDIQSRPLLANGTQRIFELYKERIDLYRKAADIRIDNKGSLPEVIDEIVHRIQVRSL